MTVEHKQSRAPVSCTGGELPGIGRAHTGRRRQEDGIDGVEQRRDHLLPPPRPTEVSDEQEAAELDPPFDRRHEPELRQPGCSTPVTSDGDTGEQLESQAGGPRRRGGGFHHGRRPTLEATCGE